MCKAAVCLARSFCKLVLDVLSCGQLGALTTNCCVARPTGTLPPSLLAAFSPGQVFALDLSSNRLSGTLPEPWGNATSLFDRFSISNNSLSGSIPNSWASLMLNSSSFDISWLQLSGGLPGVLWGGVNITQTAP